MTLFTKILLLALFISISQKSSSQDFFLSEIIEKSKKSIVPVLGRDVEWSGHYRPLGTGVVIGDRKLNREFILTCEHVISIKDSITQRSIRTVGNLHVNFNLHNDSIITVPIKLVYSDTVNDFALLEYSFSGILTPKDSLHRIDLIILPFDSFDKTDDLKEGEPLLYIGYPLSLGVGLRNFPISRRGIVAQNIKDSSMFLIDGFVQGGNSGSPVFRIKQSSFKLSGIAQAYPNERAEIRYKGKKKNDWVAMVNPGFTKVRKIDVISKVLIEKFGFSR